MDQQLGRIVPELAPDLARFSHHMALEVLTRTNVDFDVSDEIRLEAIARLRAIPTAAYGVLTDLHRRADAPTLATFAAEAVLELTELIDPTDTDGAGLAADLVCWIFIGTFFSRLFERPRSFFADPPVRGLYSRILRRSSRTHPRRSVVQATALLSTLIRRAWVVAEQIAAIVLMPIRHLADAARREVRSIRAEARRLGTQANRSQTRARRLAIRRFLRRAHKTHEPDADWSTKRADDLLKKEGKSFLKEEIKASINSFLVDGRVEDIYYISFQIN